MTIGERPFIQNPCPNCGDIFSVFAVGMDFRDHYATCVSCWATGPHRESPDDAISAFCDEKIIEPKEDDEGESR